MIHLLPANLATLAALTADNSSSPMSGVRLTALDGGDYRAEATNGRYGAIITGVGAPAGEYPSLPALESAPCEASDSVVPAVHWKAAFKAVTRPGRKRGRNPILANVAVVVGKDVTTLVSTDLDSVAVSQPRNLDGRYPDLPRAVADVVAKPAASRVRVDAALLIELLKVAAAVSDDGSVEIELRGGESPVVVRASTADQKFDGILMPLT